MTNATRMYKSFRKHPALFTGDFKKEWLHCDFLEISKAFLERTNEDDAGVVDNVDAVIPKLLRKETEGVYSFNVFSEDFVRMFNEEIDNFYDVSKRENIPVRRPNSMNNYGVIVNEIGMRPLITFFQKDYLWPLSRHLFPVEASQFDDHHSFIVRYRAEEDLGLDMHTDDSDVTFNVCLGDNFTGATLSFCGMIGARDHRQHTHTYHHQVGRAILHLGNRRHGADDVESGRRSNLIVWNHNHMHRAHVIKYEQEEFSPSPICLSYTHDRDYETFKEMPGEEKKRILQPWCPPHGAEYVGFRDKKRD